MHKYVAFVLVLNVCAAESTGVESVMVSGHNHALTSDKTDFMDLVGDVITGKVCSQNDGRHIADDVTATVTRPRMPFLCRPIERLTNSTSVQLVNASRLFSLLLAATSSSPSPSTESVRLGVGARASPATASSALCHLVMFYTPTCRFSAAVAPDFHALARYFPHVQLLAIDVLAHTSLIPRFGVVAVPMFVLFVGSRAAAAFNESQPSLVSLADFLQRHTNLSAPNTNSLIVSPSDCHDGPLSCEALHEPDWCLVLAWAVTVTAAFCWLANSRACRALLHAGATWWREAQLHQHQD